MTTSGPVATGLIPVITTWIWRIATLTGTWWLQTLAGGVILGMGLATLVLHSRLRTAVQGTEEGTLREAWRLWRDTFRDAQLRITLPILTVVVLGFYAVALRGRPLAITVALLGAVYLLWLMHLPAVAAATDRERPPATWLLTAQLIARAPLPCLLAGVVAGGVIVALVVWFPGGLVLAVPALPALAATLAVQRATSEP